MSTNPANVGQRVREIRKSRGLSAAKLAEAANVAPNTVSAIENGKGVRPSSLKAVLDTLDIEALAEGDDARTYPDDVELVRDLVGMYLVALPVDERPGVAFAITRFLMQRGAVQPSDPN